LKAARLAKKPYKEIDMSEPQTPARSLAHKLAGLFSAFPQVQAVALAGSQTRGVVDHISDIDLYVYTTAVIPLEKRLALVEQSGGAARADMDLRFWDLGDEWYDAASGIEVDIIYWDTPWIEAQLDRVLVHHLPGMGYTTCFWNTIRSSQPLVDPTGWFQSLQVRASQPYPEELRRAIIAMNHAVLRRVIPSYVHQIEKAIQRSDRISVNHRVAALLASYFDVIFALNRVLNPGEKRLIQLTREQCAALPQNMAEQVSAVLRAESAPEENLLPALATLLDGLDNLLNEEGFDPATSAPFA
jgi:hypothetical protein